MTATERVTRDAALSAIVELPAPRWADKCEPASIGVTPGGEGEDIGWSSESSVSATFYDESGREAKKVTSSMHRIDVREADLASRSEGQTLIYSNLSTDDGLTIIEARKFAAGIVELCDRAESVAAVAA
jgi:hypothetical protein